MEAQINYLRVQMEEFKEVTRLQKAGGFNGRHREEDCKENCNKYTYSHTGSEKYLAEGKRCNTCREM